jgi:hypothetical protein
VDRIPEPQRPLPAGKTEHPNERGTRIHEAAELFVKGGVELLPELNKFAEGLTNLRTAFQEKAVTVEGEWALDRNWSPVAWGSDTAWVRMKLDVFHQLNATDARVIDHKTGKRIGNELKHTEQGQLYQLAAFMRVPELTKIDVEFWYLDLGEVDKKTYTREQGMRYIEKFEKRGLAMTECLEFKPNPNKFTCRWCPFKGGACEFGVET